MSRLISAIESVTVGVSDLPAALHLFHDVMGLAIESRHTLSAQRMRFWGLDDGVRGERVELSCRGYPLGRLRLLALDPVPREVVRLDTQLGGPDSPLDIGPKAIDFYVRTPAEACWQEMVDAGCTARSKPVRHVIGGADSEESVLFGPDGVPLLIMVGHNHPPEHMRAGAPHGKYSEVATMSVVAGDLPTTRRFYADTLGLQTATDDETPAQFRNQVNKLVGIAPGSRVHFLMYQDGIEPSGKILLVNFGGASQRRLAGRMHPRRLGVGLFTHITRDLGALHTRLLAHAPGNGARIEVEPRDVDGVHSMLVRGPNEELFEFVEQP
jgi:catechol 2,3-dioxygenase-like lactoylglutathione lyase family enzyme